MLTKKRLKDWFRKGSKHGLSKYLKRVSDTTFALQTTNNITHVVLKNLREK